MAVLSVLCCSTWLLHGIESRGYSFSDELEVRALAYADNLAIASSLEEDILVMLTRMEELGQVPVQCGKVCVAIHNLPEWQKGGSAHVFPS